MKLLKFTGRLSLIYEILPYYTRGSNIKNRFSLIRSLLFGKNCNIKFKNGINYSINIKEHNSIIDLVSVERYSEIFKIDKNKVQISFDSIHKFFISLNQLTKEDKILLSLFHYGLRDGAFFISEYSKNNFKNEKILKVIQGNKNIIETSNGIKFYSSKIAPEVIIEIFVRGIHNSYSNDLMDKIVIDVGAAVGDTALYFASKGANVYAIEMTKSNYHHMIENLKLNPNLSKKITPIHAAVGKDEMINYFGNPSEDVTATAGASFLINKYGDEAIKESVVGMSIKTIISKFKIPYVDLLKMDCKGCEYLLDKDDLKSVKNIKIEYVSYNKSHKIDLILNLLKEVGFSCIIFKHEPKDNLTFKNSGNILAKKILSKTD
jgi:FkbM family methyltransferase